MYLLPIIKVRADGAEVSGQGQASAWDLPLLFQDPAPAGRAMLQRRTCWEACRVQAKGFRLLVSEELVQPQVLGTEGEGLLLLFRNFALRVC